MDRMMRAARKLSTALLYSGLVVGACAASKPGVRQQGSAHDVTFRDLQGRTTTLRPYAGKVVVLHVFTTWDIPSLRSVPELNALAQERKSDVQVAAVGLDLEGPLALRPFVDTFGPTYPVLMPDEVFSGGRSVFGPVKEVPRLYIIGRDGSIRQGYAGYVPYEELLKMVDAERKRR